MIRRKEFDQLCQRVKELETTLDYAGLTRTDFGVAGKTRLFSSDEYERTNIVMRKALDRLIQKVDLIAGELGLDFVLRSAQESRIEVFPRADGED